MGHPSTPQRYHAPPSDSLPDPRGIYATRQYRLIGQALDTVVDMTPQVAIAAPKVVKDGMQRLARSPWHPASGQMTDAWVYYDQPSGTWKLL